MAKMKQKNRELSVQCKNSGTFALLWILDNKKIVVFNYGGNHTYHKILISFFSITIV